MSSLTKIYSLVCIMLLLTGCGNGGLMVSDELGADTESAGSTDSSSTATLTVTAAVALDSSTTATSAAFALQTDQGSLQGLDVLIHTLDGAVIGFCKTDQNGECHATFSVNSTRTDNTATETSWRAPLAFRVLNAQTDMSLDAFTEVELNHTDDSSLTITINPISTLVSRLLQHRIGCASWGKNCKEEIRKLDSYCYYTTQYDALQKENASTEEKEMSQALDNLLQLIMTNEEARTELIGHPSFDFFVADIMEDKFEEESIVNVSEHLVSENGRTKYFYAERAYKALKRLHDYDRAFDQDYVSQSSRLKLTDANRCPDISLESTTAEDEVDFSEVFSGPCQDDGDNGTTFSYQFAVDAVAHGFITQEQLECITKGAYALGDTQCMTHTSLQQLNESCGINVNNNNNPAQQNNIDYTEVFSGPCQDDGDNGTTFSYQFGLNAIDAGFLTATQLECLVREVHQLGDAQCMQLASIHQVAETCNLQIGDNSSQDNNDDNQQNNNTPEPLTIESVSATDDPSDPASKRSPHKTDPIIVEFNKPVNSNYVHAQSFTVYRDGDKATNSLCLDIKYINDTTYACVVYDQTTAPYTTLDEEQLYYIYIDPNIRGTDTSILGVSYKISFKTSSYPANWP